MKKVISRLDTLLKVRSLKERKLQRELLYAEQKERATTEAVHTLEQQLNSLLQTIVQKREEQKYPLLTLYSHLLERLNHALSEAKALLGIQAQQVTLKKKELENSFKARKIIEKIRERQYDQQRVVIEQTEEALLDEIASRPSHV